MRDTPQARLVEDAFAALLRRPALADAVREVYAIAAASERRYRRDWRGATSWREAHPRAASVARCAKLFTVKWIAAAFSALHGASDARVADLFRELRRFRPDARAAYILVAALEDDVACALNQFNPYTLAALDYVTAIEGRQDEGYYTHRQSCRH